MLEIYDYQHAHLFLKEVWVEKKKKNPAFSLRAWAKRLGLRGHTSLNLMLNGKRAIPRKYIPQLIQQLELSAREGLYLEALLGYDQATEIPAKDFYLQRLRELSPKPLVRLTEVEHFTVMRDPLHTFIMEMTDLADFRPDPRWIARRLAVPRAVSQIQEAIERLIGLGLLREENGAIRKTNAHVTNLPDIVNKGVQEYHKAITRIAGELISCQPVNEREFSSYSINVRRSSIPTAKEMMREFITQFAQAVEARPGEGEETYQISQQFFRISKPVIGDPV